MNFQDACLYQNHQNFSSIWKKFKPFEDENLWKIRNYSKLEYFHSFITNEYFRERKKRTSSIARNPIAHEKMSFSRLSSKACRLLHTFQSAFARNARGNFIPPASEFACRRGASILRGIAYVAPAYLGHVSPTFRSTFNGWRIARGFLFLHALSTRSLKSHYFEKLGLSTEKEGMTRSRLINWIRVL